MLFILACIASCQNDDAPMQQENNPNDTITNPGNDTVIPPPVPIDSIKVLARINTGIYWGSQSYVAFGYYYNQIVGTNVNSPYRGLAISFDSIKRPKSSYIRVANDFVVQQKKYFFEDNLLIHYKVNDYDNSIILEADFTYDSNNVLLTSALTPNSGSTFVTSYFYDGFGNVSELRNEDGTLRVKYYYDNANNPFISQPNYFTIVAMESNEFTRDIKSFVNNVTQIIRYDEAGNITEELNYSYEYDADNFPVKRTTTSSGGNVTEIIEYQYSYIYIYE
ncbi:hypothetical protein [Flavobacterium akiainvivens]|nr:hypothetical protein [Flavobacterium akiainvivens]